VLAAHASPALSDREKYAIYFCFTLIEEDTEQKKKWENLPVAQGSL